MWPLYIGVSIPTMPYPKYIYISIRDTKYKALVHKYIHTDHCVRPGIELTWFDYSWSKNSFQESVVRHAY